LFDKKSSKSKAYCLSQDPLRPAVNSFFLLFIAVFYVHLKTSNKASGNSLHLEALTARYMGR